MKVDLCSLERVPSEAEQGMVGGVVRDFDPLGYGITTGNCCLAGVQWRPVNSLTGPGSISLEGITREPIISPTGFSLCTIRVVPTCLARDIGAFEFTLQETVLCSLLFSIGWEVAWS